MVRRSASRTPYTDLAVETFDPQRAPDGIRVSSDQRDGIRITRVHVLDERGRAQVGRPPGTYVTIEAPDLFTRGPDRQEQAAAVVAEELTRLLRLEPDDPVFVVGLGNWNATPDALGPRVVDRLLITRHLQDYVPEDLRGKLRPVSALAPGVLGITGIETSEIIRGIVDRVQPKTVIAIDALAARGLDRILTTIQIADTGIHPGSGVGNHRAGITQETLGVPVVAIGVPTVVHAVTIATQTVDLLTERLRDRESIYKVLAGMSAEEERALIDEVLGPTVGDLMVTPKEIDVFIKQAADLLAASLNHALHPGITSTDLAEALR
ncbi:MAG: GPR endopeptidase [Bacillota bacterium]|nr:GPR endopeptidase [Bacillota bacterium]REJ37828.1 MAG: GPR endopeptidase [Bacillota bacterium]